MKPEHGKLEAVQDFSTSETKSQVRAFLGLTVLSEIHPRLLEYCSSIDTPHQEVAAFHKLQRLLCSSPVLSSPDFTRPFILQMDASDCGGRTSHSLL